jgi:hypothetical protein
MHAEKTVSKLELCFYTSLPPPPPATPRALLYQMSPPSHPADPVPCIMPGTCCHTV